MQPGSLKTPLLMIRVIPDKPEETQALWEACAVLSSEDPLLQAEYVRTTGEIRLHMDFQAEGLYTFIRPEDVG